FGTAIASQHLSQGKLVFTAAKPKHKQKATYGMSPFDFLKSNYTTNSFKPGDKVFHNVFGKGVFITAQALGTIDFYTVDF
ncbi:DNA helicase II, partial [Francisella tularensis subsp. holarctica]|nr:DNA helicase II [Francisella tularensis subsp. holarctica]